MSEKVAAGVLVICLSMMLSPSTHARTYEAAKSDRYIDNGDGTVTDTKTNLMWKKCAEGQSGDKCNGTAITYGWDTATSNFGGGGSFAGYSDWKIPTIDELKSLVYCSNGTPTPLPDKMECATSDAAYQHPTIDTKSFPNVGLHTVFWSSSTHTYIHPGDFVWHVAFYTGYADSFPKDGDYHQVRLVRRVLGY